jgi:DNA-binding MarR family transcriptional regulator
MRRAAAPKAPRDRGEALGEVLAFMRLLWAVDHGLRSVSKRMERSLGLTGPQRLVLRIVGRFPDRSAGEIASLLHLHPSTLTGILLRLESAGLLRRTVDPDDARRALFALTARGEKVDTIRKGTVEQAVRRVLADLPRGQVSATEEVLAALAGELDRIG